MIKNIQLNFCGRIDSIVKANDNLYGGPKLNYKDLKYVKKINNVGLVIDLRHHYFPKVFIEKTRCLILGIKHSWKPMTIKDDFPDRIVFENIADRVKKTSSVVYVHCKSGEHRTNFVLSAVDIINNKKSVESQIEVIPKRNYWHINRLTNVEARKKTLARNLELFKKMFING